MGGETRDLGIDGLSEAVYVGSGGSATVYAATRLDTGQTIAVKLLRAAAGNENERKRFEREKVALEKLAAQDGIVPIIDSGISANGDPYFLMPLMATSLQAEIDEKGAIDWETASRLMAQVADSVSYAHEKDVLHRDLKPGNILIDESGVPRVSDFGIAKLTDVADSKSSKSLGTPAFMPPERFDAAEPARSADIYGLGATLSALITGTPPFTTGQGDTDAAIMKRVIIEPAPDLSGTETPASIAALVRDSMAKDPDDRPPTAAAFAQALRSALREQGADAAEPVTIAVDTRERRVPLTTKVVSPRRNANSSRRRMLAVAAVLFLTLLGGGLLISQFLGTGGNQLETTSAVSGAADSADLDQASPLEPEQVDESSTTTEANQIAQDSDATGSVNDGDAGDVRVDPPEVLGATENAVPISDQPDADAGGASDDQRSSVTDEFTPEGPVERDPLACFNASATSVKAEQRVSFTNCSTDAEAFNWDFGGDGTSTTANPSHSFDREGRYTVTLTARGNGKADTATRTITVAADSPPPPPPVACFDASTLRVEADEPITLTNCSERATSYIWAFGDDATSTSPSPTHSWSSPGTYVVTLQAMGEGGSHSTTQSISVIASSDPLDACMEIRGTQPRANESWIASDCSTGADSVTWDFGDGTTSNARQVNKVWPTAGSYTVTLTARNAGGTDSASRTITVKPPLTTEDPPPAPHNLTCDYLTTTEVRWTWAVFARVDSYVIEFANGTRQDIGKLGQYEATDGAVARVVAKVGALETATAAGSCEAFGGTKPSQGAPPAPSGIRCTFSGWTSNDADTNWASWLESWRWTTDPSVDETVVTINDNGALRDESVGKANAWGPSRQTGAPNVGVGLKAITAVRGNETTRVSLRNCGAEGGEWIDHPNHGQ